MLIVVNVQFINFPPRVTCAVDTGVTLLATYQKKFRVLATQKEKRKLSRGLASGSTLLKTIDHGSVDSVADANRMALMVL
jgi:hypothetical protein